MSRAASPWISSGAVTTSPSTSTDAMPASTSAPRMRVLRDPVCSAPTTTPPPTLQRRRRSSSAVLFSCLLQERAEGEDAEGHVDDGERRQQLDPRPTVGRDTAQRGLERSGGSEKN